ncbi:MAG: hypothetical protein IIX87_03025, partial [Firmicutes bacterium]|nr:hypothetical protein [Bacillota bacterium]
EIGAYFSWWGKATTAVERGQSLPETKGHRIFSKVVLAVTMILLIMHEYIIASGASEAASEIAGSILYVMVYMAIVFIIRAISKFFQKKHMPKALNVILTFIIAFILILLFATPLL